MRPDDVYALTSAGDPRLSPDGRLIAYVVTQIDREESAYRSAIWVVPVDGSEEPRQFTSGERRDGSPRWSPDGRWLAFASNRDGEDEAEGEGAALRHAGGRRRAAQAHRRRRVGRGDRLVARLDPHRLRAPRARRGVRGGGRPQARAAALHARLLQARQRRLGRRPPQAPLRRRHRRRRRKRAAAHRGRLRERQPGVVARRQADRVRVDARRPLGRRLHRPPLRARSRWRRAASRGS